MRKKQSDLQKIEAHLNRAGSQLSIIDRRLELLRDDQQKNRRFPEIPPKWVLKAARANLNRTNHWPDYYAVLCDFYGLSHVTAGVDPKIKPNTIAEYRPSTKSIHSKETFMTHHTAMHEFWHFLNDVMHLATYGEQQQALADAYADAVIARENEP